MKRPIAKLTLAALLSALALALSYAERAFPLPLLLPLPGIKLGLANLVTLFALCTLGGGWASAILAVRCLLGAVFAGNLSALFYSLLGGFSALGAMLLLRRGRFSLFGISVGGAAAHAIGQIAAALVLLGTTAPLRYLPYLLGISLLTGSVTALLSSLLLRTLTHAGLVGKDGDIRRLP